MLKKISSLTLIVLLMQMFFVLPTFAGTKEEKFTEKVKTGIAKLGTGPEAKIKVKLKDGTKIKGYIMEVSESGFVAMNSKTNQTVPVAYSNVKQVRGNNISEGVKILIGVGAIILLVAIMIAVVNSQGGG